MGGAIAAGSGVGGGALYIPIFVLILRMTAHVAVPLSKVTIFGVAIGGYLVLVRKRHPKVDRPLIDYNLALLMEPLILAGTIIGVFANVSFPSYLIIILLVLLLGANAYRTFVKGLQLYKEEKAITNAPVPAEPTIQAVANEDEEADTDDVFLKQRRDSIVRREARTPWHKLLALILLEGGMLTLILLKGGLTGESVIGVRCGTWQYWTLVCAAFPYLFIFVIIVAKLFNMEHRKKMQVGYNYLKEDLKWTKKYIGLFFILSIVSGIAAGGLGIGAGIVTGPILIELGVIPQVATATSSYLILFTSSATTAQFLVLGKLAWKYGIWYWVVGFCAAVLGQFVVAEVIKKYKKQAFVNFLLAFVVTISAILMVVVEGLSTYKSIVNHASMGFSPICGLAE